MNAQDLKRVIRAIADGSKSDLEELAGKIVDVERKAGRTRLADELEGILKHSRSKSSKQGAPTSEVSRAWNELPLSRRHGEELATLVAPDQLPHHMVLPQLVEARFARIEAEYTARDRLAAFGLTPKRKILIYGPPGCGKSLGAMRLAWTIGLPLVKVKFDVLISSFFGDSARNLRSIFSSSAQQPCVLLLDECDFIARSRSSTKDIGEASRIVNTLLQLMEDYDAPGLLVATTNLESSLDPALFRRFDDVFMIPLPGAIEIRKLLQLTLSAMSMKGSFRWDQIVRQLEGASAAMVVKAARDAAKAAVLSGRSDVTNSHLEQAVSEL